MLTILIVENTLSTLNIVHQVCGAVTNSDVLHVVSTSLDDKADVPGLNENEALLAFVEATSDAAPMFADADNATVRWLKALQEASGDRLVRVFVLSTSAHFHAEESRFAWLSFPILTGYEVVGGSNEGGRLVRDEIRSVIEQMVETMGDRIHDSQRQFDLGQWLTLPKCRASENPDVVYQRSRLASFLVGGMRDTLLELQRIHQILKESAPPPTLEGHPLRKGVKSCFDALLYASQEGKPRPDWCDKLRGSFHEATIAPHLLLLGQTGSGKTMLAREMHRMRFDYDNLNESDRAFVDRLFVEVNCAALPPGLAAGELFGGVKGAWNDLTHNMPGAIFSALGGTLFLDEFGELPETVQAMLLKYLDTGTYYPVGGFNCQVEVHTFVIAATNRPVEEWAQEGAFRRDLIERFRLRLHLPSLLERRAYLPQLCDFVLQNPRINPGSGITAISHRALRKLETHTWPGNFRELQQVLWRAVYQARLDGLRCIRARHILFSAEL